MRNDIATMGSIAISEKKNLLRKSISIIRARYYIEAINQKGREEREHFLAKISSIVSHSSSRDDKRLTLYGGIMFTRSSSDERVGEGVKRAPFIIVLARSEEGGHSHVDPPRVRRWVREGSFNLVFNQATTLPREEGLLNHPPIRADAASLPPCTLEREGAVNVATMLFLGFRSKYYHSSFFPLPKDFASTSRVRGEQVASSISLSLSFPWFLWRKECFFFLAGQKS